jgi:hypothetical protein
MNSILTSIKKLLMIDEDYEQFDADIIMHINTVLLILTQMGIGPTEGFSITSKEETWDDFLGEDLSKLQMVKTYIGLRVRLIFDPPLSSSVVEVINQTIKELEYRMYITENPKDTFSSSESATEEITE